MHACSVHHCHHHHHSYHYRRRYHHHSPICSPLHSPPSLLLQDVPGVEITEDVSSIVGADDIDLVVEVAGGVTDAKDIVWGALKAGQDVVTANKALITKHLGNASPSTRPTTSQRAASSQTTTNQPPAKHSQALANHQPAANNE